MPDYVLRVWRGFEEKLLSEMLESKEANALQRYAQPRIVHEPGSPPHVTLCGNARSVRSPFAYTWQMLKIGCVNKVETKQRIGLKYSRAPYCTVYTRQNVSKH